MKEVRKRESSQDEPALEKKKAAEKRQERSKNLKSLLVEKAQAHTPAPTHM